MSCIPTLSIHLPIWKMGYNWQDLPVKVVEDTSVRRGLAGSMQTFSHCPYSCCYYFSRRERNSKMTHRVLWEAGRPTPRGSSPQAHPRPRQGTQQPCPGRGSPACPAKAPSYLEMEVPVALRPTPRELWFVRLAQPPVEDLSYKVCGLPGRNSGQRPWPAGNRLSASP